jgi:hypothetical protein
MAIKVLSMTTFWKAATLVVLVAVPIVLLAKIKADEKGLVPERGDDSDIFDSELTVD